MNKNLEIKEILSAVDTLLNNTKKDDEKHIFEKETPLLLEKEVKKNKIESIPKDTEKIILQAEKYLKK